MKNFKYTAIILLAALIMSTSAPAALALDDPQIVSNAVVLADINSERIFYSKNEDMKVYPASLTKVMTALLAVEAIENGTVSLSDEVTASENITYDLESDGSTAGIVPGETMTLEELLYCTMLASANEACNVIAEYISGSVQDFIDLMNRRAKELGCTYTNFANTHGLPNENHYTTAYDFALISKEAVSHSLFMEICNTTEITIAATNMSEPRSLENTNALLHKAAHYPDYRYEYASGVKTGYTSSAGYCLVSTAAKDGVQLLAVVMGGPVTENADGTMSHGNFTDSVALYEWVFNNFSFQEILKSSELITEVPVEMGAGMDSVLLRPAQSISALLPNDTEPGSFEREITVYSEQDGEPLQAPIDAGAVLGEIRITQNGVVYGAAKLVASSSVEVSRMQYMKAQVLAVWEKPIVKAIFWIIILLAATYIVLVVRYRRLRKKHVRSQLAARRAREAAETEAYTKRVFTPPQQVGEPVQHPEPEENAPAEVVDISEARRKNQERDYFEEFFKK